MARFEIEANGKRYEVEAPDMQAAMSALRGGGQAGPDFSQTAPMNDRPQLQTALDNKAVDYMAAKSPMGPAGFGDKFANEVTFGLSKDASALAHAVGGKVRSFFGGPATDFGKDYAEGRDIENARLKQYARTNPVGNTVAGTLGTVGGIAATAPVAALSAPMTGAQMVRQGATGGAALGAMAGSDTEANDIQSRLAGAAVGAGTGAAVGAAAPIVGNEIGRWVGNKLARGQLVQQADQFLPNRLRGRAQMLYRAADQEGVVVKPNTFQSIVNDVVIAGQRAGADPQVTPAAWGAIQRLQREAATGQPVSLETMDTLRQVIGGTLREGSGASGAMFGRISDLMNNLRAGDVIARNPVRATTLLRDARAMWQRMAKARTIQSAIANAENSASGTANGLRNEFRKLLKVNPNTGRPVHNWTPDERRAIQRVVRGGTVRKFLGSFGFPIDQGRNWLGAAGTTMAGVAAGLGPLAAVPPAVGTAARLADNILTQRAAVGAGALAGRGAMPATRGVARVGVRAALPAARLATPTIAPWMRDRILPAR